jgi:hypothetical protein
VRQGGLRDAILHSAGANAAHGLRPTNADTRRAVLMLLQDEEWAAWSDNAVAKACAVSQPLAAKVRADHLQTFEDAPRTVSRGGKIYSMDVERIGRKPAEPAPSEPLEAAPAEPPAVPEEPPCAARGCAAEQRCSRRRQVPPRSGAGLCRA